MGLFVPVSVCMAMPACRSQQFDMTTSKHDTLNDDITENDIIMHFCKNDESEATSTLVWCHKLHLHNSGIYMR